MPDHGVLPGLTDDDHLQYIKDSEFTQDSGVLVGTGSGTFQEETGATLRTSLGLGTGDNVNFATVDGLTLTALSTGFSITGGTTSKTLGILGNSNINQSLLTNSSVTFAEVIVDNITVDGHDITSTTALGLKATGNIEFFPDGETDDLASWSASGGDLYLDTEGGADLYIKGDNDLLLQPDNIIQILSGWTATSQTCADLGTVSLGALANAVTHSQWDAAYTHSGDSSQAHSDYLLNDQNDTMAGVLTAEGLTLDDVNYVRFGAGGLSGALGCDGRIYSDDANLIIQVESLAGANADFTNPSLTFSSYNFAGANLRVPVISSPRSTGIIFLNRSVYAKDTTGVANAFVGAVDYATDNNYILMQYYSAKDYGQISTSVGDINVVPAGNLNIIPSGTGIRIGSNVAPTAALDVTGEGKFSSHLSLSGGNELRLYDVGNSNYVGFEAPALTADQIWVLPATDGNADEVIKTDGSGALSFVRMPKAIYAELSDSADQTFAVAGTHYSITFNTNNEIAGITHSTSVDPENITIITTGVYTIFAQPQVKAAAGGAGTFHMWLQNNTGSGFVDIADTNIELSLASSKEDVIPLATTFLLTAGDIIRLRVNVSDNGISLDAQAAIVGPPTEPAIPSIIFTMFMIGI